jgi:hypothetical protein
MRGVRIFPGRPTRRAPLIQRVDRHFRLGRSGDLDSSIDKIGRCWSHGPFRRAHLPRLGKEIRRRRPGNLFPADAPRSKQLIAPPTKTSLQLLHEREGVGRQNLLATLIGAANDLDVGCTIVHVLPR